ncbi:MAG: haloacid dehalogenase-like hydrolase, partial [Fibrobacterota bacterium]
MTSMTDQSVRKKQPLALFDFDDTISIGDTMLHWQRWYLHKRRVRWILPWIWGGCALKAMGRSRLWFKRFYMATSNRETESSRENLVREFRRELLSQIVYPELVERAWLH